MLRNLVLVADQSSFLLDAMPRRSASEVRHCRTRAQLLASATHETATCAVLTGELATPPIAAELHARCPDLPIVAVSAATCATAHVTVGPRVAGRGELARVVRFLLGEPQRQGPRVRAAGTVTVGDAVLAIVDLAEGGVRVAVAPDEVQGEVELAIAIGAELQFQARARELRRDGDGGTVFGFLGLHGRDHQRVRSWLLARAGACPHRRC